MRISAAVLLLVLSSARGEAQSGPVPAAPPPEEPITITRATGPISIDGDLSDAGWKNVKPLEKWYEINPGDNVEPKVKSVAWLAYDDHFLYAAFHFYDPHPEQIRAPFGDRDNLSQSTDYGGLIIDARNDGKTAVLLLASPNNIQYDSVSDDSTGNEDSSPDFYWDSAARITPDGWTLEIRVPFSSMRYKKSDPQIWGLMLYRNWPRDRRYQMFTNRIPQGGNCFICNERKLVGLSGLPGGGHIVAAPYVTMKDQGAPREGILGNGIVTTPARGDGGADVKWTPSADTAIDGTLNPDFSQVESDVAAIAANQRFAIFFPEKRPFFLEGLELFNTPIQAVYTRTITSPRFGLRSTGKFGQNAYTFLVTQDRGGGSIILPGAESSNLANQDFGTTVAIGRIRHDIGVSFVSMMLADRENSGGSHNRVFGPDFQWRPTKSDTVTGQLLYSDTRTPNHPELADEWNGQHLASHAGDLWWSHSTKTIDWFTEYKDFGDQFRADSGFVPQVGYRDNNGEVGYTLRPKGFFSRIRLFINSDYQSMVDGRQLAREVSAGAGMDGKYSSFSRFRFSMNHVRLGDRVFTRHQLFYTVQITPTAWLSDVVLDGSAGQDVDFANNRLGRGANITLGGTLHPMNHLELRLNNGLRFLSVPVGIQQARGRLFTAQVERIKATYTFNSRMFVRAITQNVRTNQNQALFINATDQHIASLSTSLLFAYKLNWQTVLFVGVGDTHAVDEENELRPSDRQLFLKLSYAFQR